MKWTAWSNGAGSRSGAGHGLKVPVEDRDRHFDRSWTTVELELPGPDGPEVLELGVAKRSFWNDTCRELIDRRIGLWLIAQGLSPWPRGAPPKVTVEVVGSRRFRVVR